MLRLKWLESFLQNHIGATSPDGRPLYAYKCKEEDYEDLKRIVFFMFQSDKPHTLLGFEPLFCLFASETWRRKHSGGHWAWETVFSEILQPVPAHSIITKYVSKGLKYWKRELLKTGYGDNQYLITIACEGGLPLLLLQNENAKLHQYFKTLMEYYHRERQRPRYNIFDLAEKASYCLPKSLQRNIVYQLSGDLIEKIVKLQENVADATDPITTLNRHHPNWRNQLPLPIEDDTAEILLKNLVLDAQILSIKSREKIRWRRLLIQNGEQWSVEQTLEIPKIIFGSTLMQWMGQNSIPARLRLFLQTDKSFEPIALITRLQDQKDDTKYKCDFLKRNEIKFCGKEILENAQIVLSDGSDDTIVHPQNGQDWGTLPWIFAEKNGGWEYIGEGSIRTKEETTRVLATHGGVFKNDICNVTQIGETTELYREIWQVTGNTMWQHPDLGSCRIQCANTQEEDYSYFLNGNRLPGVADQYPPFIGIPELYTLENNGTIKHVSDGTSVEWRPYKSDNTEWSKKLSDCYGEVWIRYANSSGGHVYLSKVRIVPDTTKINIKQVGNNVKPGILGLSGLMNAQVYVNELHGCSFMQNYKDDGSIEIECNSIDNILSTHFSAEIYWNNNRILKINLPLPIEGASFIYAEKALPFHERAPVNKLSAIRAVSQALTVTKRFDLKIKIKTNKTIHHEREKIIPLFTKEEGKSILYLHKIQEEISSMLSLTGEMDSCAIIQITDSKNIVFAELEVGIFDVHFVPDKENNLVLLPDECQYRLENDWKERISVRMIKLWDPASEPIYLKMHETDKMFIIPESLEPGPYWVLGEYGNWPRFRPLRWVIAGEQNHANSHLRRAILASESEIRTELLDRWVDQIALDPENEDWPLFYDYLELTKSYPASALDLFIIFVKSPEALIMALLKANEEQFNIVWELSKQLPFSWYLLPVKAWLNSARRFFNSLRLALYENDRTEDILWDYFNSFRERLTDRQPFFRQVFDWLCQYIFPDRILNDSELKLAQNCPEMIYNFIKDEEKYFQSRHHPDEHYPEGAQTMLIVEENDYPMEQSYQNLVWYLRPVRCAPFVAAFISVNGFSYDEKIIFEMKRFRGFDREWFNRTFAFALCLGLIGITA